MLSEICQKNSIDSQGYGPGYLGYDVEMFILIRKLQKKVVHKGSLTVKTILFGSMLVIALVTLTGCGGGGNPTDKTYGTVSASRISGVAPLAVHFSTDFSGTPEKSLGFHDYDYSWDFGDPVSGASGKWGTDGKSKKIWPKVVLPPMFSSPPALTPHGLR